MSRSTSTGQAGSATSMSSIQSTGFGNSPPPEKSAGWRTRTTRSWAPPTRPRWKTRSIRLKGNCGRNGSTPSCSALSDRFARAPCARSPTSWKNAVFQRWHWPRSGRRRKRPSRPGHFGPPPRLVGRSGEPDDAAVPASRHPGSAGFAGAVRWPGDPGGFSRRSTRADRHARLDAAARNHRRLCSARRQTGRQRLRRNWRDAAAVADGTGSVRADLGGLSFQSPDAWPAFAASVLGGELPVTPELDTTALSVRFLCDDVKALYGEAAQAVGPKPSPMQVDTWFWRQTVAGGLAAGVAPDRDGQREQCAEDRGWAVLRAGPLGGLASAWHGG